MLVMQGRDNVGRDRRVECANKDEARKESDHLINCILYRVPQ